MTTYQHRSLERAAQLGWEIARLHRENAIDQLAALQSLDALYQHPHPRVRSLALRVAEGVLVDPAVQAELNVEVIAQ